MVSVGAWLAQTIIRKHRIFKREASNQLQSA